MTTEGVTPGTGGPMVCPSCGSRLVEVERAEILIDACPGCRGVWLDRGELDKILVQERRMASNDPDEDFFREVEGRPPPSRPASPGREDSDYGTQRGDSKRGKKRRRGLLEDLLDF
jgi:uncharacterized protein